MITVEEADRLLHAHPFVPGPEKVTLLQSIGRFLAEDVLADRDFPPYDRVAMDGIAVSTAEFKGSGSRFSVEGVQWAGQPGGALPGGAVCMEVMTGAVLPKGADAVVRYEDLDIADRVATIRLGDLRPGQHIHAAGSDARRGDVLLKKGIRLTPAEVTVLASVGCSEVAVYGVPRVTVVSTGDELVGIERKPELHQIRESNVYAVSAALQSFCILTNRIHFGDDEPQVKDRLRMLLESSDILVLTGGVSQGKKDWVPESLESCGIKKLFHRVSQRPGKPFWFGSNGRCVVFALPGNPASVFLCLYRYLLPWLRASLTGLTDSDPTAPVGAVLAEDVFFHAPLTYFPQVRVQFKDGVLTARPVSGNGSGDFIHLQSADGFLELPMDQTEFKAGSVYPFYSFRG